MDQIVLSRYEHRVGQVLSGDAFCDGCNRKFDDGEMAFRCLECSGFMRPESSERTVRKTEVTNHYQYQSGGTRYKVAETKPYSGYDLCLECAKRPSLHIHHHFTLAVCRK